LKAQTGSILGVALPHRFSIRTGQSGFPENRIALRGAMFSAPEFSRQLPFRSIFFIRRLNRYPKKSELEPESSLNLLVFASSQRRSSPQISRFDRLKICRERAAGTVGIEIALN